MARWIRPTGTNSWADLHRGGDDGVGGYRFDLGPAPCVNAFAGGVGGTVSWEIVEDDQPEDGRMRTRGQRIRRGPVAYDGRPPYRIPLLPEIRAEPRNGLTVMSTFSGAGGSCLGFDWAGYRTLLACEFIPAAAETYRANHPGVDVFEADIRELTAEDALGRMGLAAGELDVLEGSPPCESFSTAGRLSSGWGKKRDYSDGKSQVMDDLFYEFSRLLDGVRPRAFVAENVSGLVKGVSKGYFKRIHAALEECGYAVQARMLDAQWLGVPQRRQRVIFVGVRNDLGVDPVFPDPLPYRYSIRDALEGIDTPGGQIDTVIGGWPVVELSADEPAGTIGAYGYSAGPWEGPTVKRIVYENGGRDDIERGGVGVEEDLDEPIRTVTNAHGAAGHFQVERLVHQNRGYFNKNGPEYEVGIDEPAPTITASGRNEYEVERGKPLSDAVRERWDKLGPGESDAEHFNLVRPDEGQPSPTIVRADGRMPHAVTHPHDPRKFSIPELRRLCGFPDDFVLTGSYAQQWERLGNSVPPPMMYHVARALADRVLLA